MHDSVSLGGTVDGQFMPKGICWVVERFFGWISHYHRLNTVFDRDPDLLAAHVWIAMISILPRRHLQSQTIDPQSF